MTARPTPARSGRAAARFGLTVAAVSLALALATLAVIARGDQVNLTPLDVTPDPAAVNVSTRASLHVRFARPMLPQSVEARLALDPPAEGRFQWSGSTLIFIPREPLWPATDYRVTLAPGLEETRGRASRTPYAWRFRTRTPAVIALRRVDGAANLWLIDPAGGAERRLTREAVDVTDFALAPDGGRVAYTRQDSPARTSIWTVNTHTGATSRLSPDEPASFSAPAWSPDGDLIVFERRQELTNAIASPKLVAARADGTPGGLVYGRGDEVGFGARWSPDGARLAFFDSVRQAIVIFNFTPDRVTIPVQTTVEFDWSPDGRHLVVEDIVEAGGAFQHVLLLADAATGATTRLTREPGLDEATPAWSPNGRSIAYTQRPTTGAIGGAQPMLLDRATGERRPLLRESAAEIETTDLAWSPDGATLLLNRLSLNDPSAETTLWVADLATGGPRQLGAGTTAAWLP